MQYGSKHTEHPTTPAAFTPGSPAEYDAYVRGLADGKVLSNHHKRGAVILGIAAGICLGALACGVFVTFRTMPTEQRWMNAMTAVEMAGKEKLDACRSSRAAADRKHLQFLEMCQLNLAAACADGHCGPERAFGVDLEPGLLQELAQPVRQ